MNNFAVFILTHGRADNVKTHDSLKRCGYTGKIYILIDNIYIEETVDWTGSILKLVLGFHY